MKRKLLVLAIAGAFVAPAAMAEGNVSIYGAANASVDITNDGAAAPATGRSANKVSSNESFIGFKASHDMGGGMSVVAQVESGIALDGTAATVGAAVPPMMGSKLAGRDTFVGLAGGFGTVLAGTHDTPYKMATRSMDVFANTIADSRSLSDHDVRLGNVLAYVSPKFSNTTIAAAVVMGGENGAAAGQTKGSAVSLAAMYGAGPINASAAYQTVTVGSAGTGSLAGAFGQVAGTKLSAFKVGVGYAADQFGVNAVVERPSVSVPGLPSTSGTNLYVGGKFNVTGADAIKLAYGKLGNTAPAGAVNTNGASQISFGYDHTFDKSTSVYVLYTKLNNDKGANRGLGQTPDGEITGAVNGGLGSSPNAISAGMRYAF